MAIAFEAMSQTATGTITKVPCNNDGIYTVSVTGMSTPITYTYYVNGTTVVHSNMNSTTDQLTNFSMGYNWISCNVSNGTQNAWAWDSYTPSFTFSLSSTHPVCPATMGTLTATRQSGTTGPFTITWTNKQTLNTYSGSPASAPVGEYSVEITDQTTGCVLEIIDSAAVIYQLSNVTGTISTTKASCTNGTATVVPSGGVAPYSFLWVNGATTATVSGLSRGSYSVEITDAQGCKSTRWAYIQQNPYIQVPTTVTNATCLQSDGQAIAFGSGGQNPYTYVWSNGQTTQTATNLSAGTAARVIATDANGCTGEGYAYIQSTTPITVTYTATPSSCTSATGSATVSYSGGTAPYSVVWYTNPQTTGNSTSNVGPGAYSFKITDAVGCVRTGSAVVPPNSTINAGVGTTNTTCPNSNGKATANVSGSDPPFTYLWNTGSTASQITGLSAGYYSCAITDSKGCSVVKGGRVNDVSPISVIVSTTPVSCKFNNDGTASSTVRGGTPPYTYSYTGGSTSANASGLGMGRHWLTVTDANGCSTSKYFYIQNAQTTNNCYCTIEGTVYLDANSNCTLDPGESGIENIRMHCSGYGYTYTNANGYYSFDVPTGSYTISEQVNAYYPLATCQSNNISVSVTAASNCSTIVNIANDTNTIKDLKIVTMNSNLPPVPGYSYQQKVVVKNLGTVTESGIQMEYEHDSQLPYVSSNFSSLTRLNPTGAPYLYSVQSGFPSLAPSASKIILLNYNTPSNVPLNTVVTFYDTVASAAPIDVNWLLDYSPWNNVNTYNATVVGSYDPNYKEVHPMGEGEEGFISSEVTEFDYTIHFQNEGTYFARNIVITDQLDDDFDWTTFVPGYSDYDYTARVSETGLVTFTFENINLPWKSNYGDALSSGLVQYSIKRKASNPKGTEFTNTADIYFDFNPPITTNTTLNTLKDDFLSVDEIDAGQSIGAAITVDLYPVPAKDVINLRVNNVPGNEVANLSIIDILGNVVQADRLSLREGSTIFTKNIENLSRGTYIALIQFDNGKVISKKLLIH